MGEFMDIMRTRRSIRKYEDRDISDKDLGRILESVKWSPSWANTQCWEVVVVKDASTKEKLQATLIKNPATKAMVQAPVVLALCGKVQSAGFYSGEAMTKFGDWLLFDLGIATQNICLTAKDLGLGTVIVGQFEHDKAREILGVPNDFEVVVLIPLGYPAKSPEAPKRREINEFTHYDTF